MKTQPSFWKHNLLPNLYTCEQKSTENHDITPNLTFAVSSMHKAWKSLTQGETSNSLSLSFSRQAFPSPSPSHLHFYFDEQYYPLRTGSKTASKAIGNLWQGSLWPHHFVLLTTHHLHFRRNENSSCSAGAQVGICWPVFHVAAGWGSLCWSLTQYPLVKHLATVISYKVLFWKQKWRYVTTPKWNPEATSLSNRVSYYRFLDLLFHWQSQTGAQSLVISERL